MTAEGLQALLQEGDNQLSNKMIRYGGSLHGTRAYWLQRRQELMDMIRIKGAPHLFFTLSAADLQWPDLHRRMPLEGDVAPDDSTKARQQRTLALQRNPHLAASYLDVRLKLFQKHILNPFFGVKDYWYRYEWQERGSGHVHGFLWLDGAPDVDKIDWKLLQSAGAATPEDQQKLMKDFVDYWDGYMSAMNPFPRKDENAPLLGEHPCAIPTSEVHDSRKELGAMLNRIQRHTKCVGTKAKCQVKRKQDGLETASCRYDFPFLRRATAGVGLDSKCRVRFEGRRNDPWLNMYHPVVMLGWRANIDLKPVMSTDAAVRYVNTS